MAYKLTVANYDRQDFERDLLLCGCPSTHSIAQICLNMPPMEADAAYQGCLKSCELHSRSLAVGRTGACDLEIAHTCVTQSPDCAYSQIARNIYTTYTCNKRQDSFLSRFINCTFSVVLKYICICKSAKKEIRKQERH